MFQMNKIKVKEKVCANQFCANTFKPFKSTDKYCRSQCYYESNKVSEKPKKAIKKVSEKRTIENIEYKKLRFDYLTNPKNQICFIDGCGKPATTIEHTRGRKGYADDWARENKISLYIDVRFWQPCCLSCNLELENNPEMAKKYQLSKIHGGIKE